MNSSISINTNTRSLETDSWYNSTTGSSDNEDFYFESESEIEDEDERVISDQLNSIEEETFDDHNAKRNNNNFSDSEGDADEFGEVNSATFIMNQKSLVDKAPGALQHSFAHRTIPLPHSYHVRLFQFISVYFICSMTAGIPFGLPALRQLLMEAGIYGKGCCSNDNNNNINNNNISGNGNISNASKRVGCSIQEGRLAIFQVSGWVSWMIGGWLAARSVQHLGPRLTGIIGCGSILLGSVLLAVSMPVEGEFLIPPWLRMYILPVMIMSVGSSFSFLACLHYVRLFPKRTSLLHSAIFLAQDLSAFIFYLMYESRQVVSLRCLLLLYAGLMLGQVLFWKFVFSSGKIPTIRFTVTTWHQRPLLVDKSLPEHITSPYFYLALIFTVAVFLKIYFYMSTFQVQLRILLIPTKRQVNPEDFTYRHNENNFDENGLNNENANNNNIQLPQNRNNQDPNSIATQFTNYDDQDTTPKPVQFFSHVPFFAEQPGGTSSNNVSLRQFIYNPMQPEIFLTDLQEMLYLLIPIASLITIFWMRSSMSDRKISTFLLFALISLVAWGFVQYNLKNHYFFVVI